MSTNAAYQDMADLTRLLLQVVPTAALAEAVRESVPLKPEENVAATREAYLEVRG